MYSVDKANFKSYLQKFPLQIIQSKAIFENSPLKLDYTQVNNIVYLGMGGSAISGDLLFDATFDSLKVPYQVVRGYELPHYCGSDSLVIASSYSGNTEEVIESLKKAKKTNCQIIVISSGGEILDLAKKNEWNWIEIPAGYPPRQSLGYLFFPALYTINPLLKKPVAQKEIDKTVRRVNSIVERNDNKLASGIILSKGLALKIQNKIPLIYSSAPYLQTVGVRWKNQFQENAKSLAFSNVIPELNHNEIVGWEMEDEVLHKFIVIFLESHSAAKRINTRIKLTKDIIRKRNVEVAEIYAEGDTVLEQMISLVCLGDWVTYYLALLYEKNPISILNIDYLKSELKKLA